MESGGDLCVWVCLVCLAGQCNKKQLLKSWEVASFGNDHSALLPTAAALRSVACCILLSD